MMNEFDFNIITISDSICKNIEKIDASERGLLSQNILDKLRNFVEAINLKIYSLTHTAKLNHYDDLVAANNFVAAKGKLKFLNRLHTFLQASVSHYTIDEDSSVRLMLKYYEYLLRIKEYIKNEFKYDVLQNIEDFPIDQDESLREYYQKIASVIERVRKRTLKPSDKFYIQKEKPFFIGTKIYYEITFTPADDHSGKINQFIAFSNVEIPTDYAIKVNFIDSKINILDRNMPIKVVDNFEVSIRQCELNHFADIFGEHTKISTGSQEYYALMEYLTQSGFNLVEIVDFQEVYYQKLKDIILARARVSHIFNVLDKVRELIQKQKKGVNVVRYLLLHLRNKLIVKQLDDMPNNWVSNLFLVNGVLAFDRMPFVSSLVNHNPKLSDIFACISSKGREDELLARHIRTNTEQYGQLYTRLDEIKHPENVPMLIDRYNSKVYSKHKEQSSLVLENNHVFINGYENDTVAIIDALKERIGNGISGYQNSVDSWLSSTTVVDCSEKKGILRKLFCDSNLALIYGAAGTGKTRLIWHISDFFANESKLYLANTHSAKDNLKQRIKVSNSDFNTVAQYTKSPINKEYDIIFIDECSTVSNRDMVKVLLKAKCKLMVLVGDVYQIESIQFGNWFGLARHFLPANIVYELKAPYRTEDDNLLELWTKVRTLDEKITEFLIKKKYCSCLDESIFDRREEEDEIILCLNYDGLYGINNINRFLQSDNSNPAISWDIWTYKVGDPVVFNENNKFAPVIYNNLKGWIRRIEKSIGKIQFDIEIPIGLNSLNIDGMDLELVDCQVPGHSIIRFSIDKYVENEDEEKSIDDIVPFHVAYAVSFHKAQGLEYNSVKIIVTNEVEELITHNIFYTAITRAREKLKIYWTPETQQKIISGLKLMFNKKDAYIISQKFSMPLTEKI